MEPHVAPALCALGVALAALLVVPRDPTPPVAPVRAEVIVPVPEAPRPILRTFRLRDHDPVTVVFEDGTTVLHTADETLAGPLSPALLEQLTALRARSASFEFPAGRVGCLSSGGLELVGHGASTGDEDKTRARKLMDAVWVEHQRRRVLHRAPLVVAATRIADGPLSTDLRIDAILKVDDGMPAPSPGVTLTIPDRLIDVPGGRSWDDVPLTGVWAIVLRPENRAEWWPQPDTDVEQARRDVAWLAAQPPPEVREALARRALEGAPEPVIQPMARRAAERQEPGSAEGATSPPAAGP